MTTHMAQPLHYKPLPLLTEWVERNWDVNAVNTFHEYRYGLDYHLRTVEREQELCSQALRIRSALHPSAPGSGFDWLLINEGNSVYIPRFTAEGLVHHGDSAIRAASSALDSGLQVVNHILGPKGVETTKNVRWHHEVGKKSQPRKNLRAALRTLPGDRGLALDQSLEQVYSSIGYELLDHYRDWVTHRGAPRIVVAEPLRSSLVELPPEFTANEDLNSKIWDVERHIEEAIRNSVAVQCVPFVPSVGHVINLPPEEVREGVSIPGVVHIAPGFTGLSVKDNRVSYGSLTEPSEVYRTMNSTELHDATQAVAGEELAAYSASDYRMAISFVAHFLREVFTGDGDRNLVELARSLHSIDEREG